MISRNNVLLDVRDEMIDCLIIFCNRRGVWSGYIKNSIKNYLDYVYSCDMRMMNNRVYGGFSYLKRNGVLFINAYVLDDNDNINREYLDLFLNTKLRDNYSRINDNRTIEGDRFGAVLPDCDISISQYVDDIFSQVMGRVSVYRFRKND